MDERESGTTTTTFEDLNGADAVRKSRARRTAVNKIMFDIHNLIGFKVNAVRRLFVDCIPAQSKCSHNAFPYHGIHEALTRCH